MFFLQAWSYDTLRNIDFTPYNFGDDIFENKKK